MSHAYFVLYDYGQGGLWAIVEAESAEQISGRIPDVLVFDEPPKWLAREALDAIRARGVQSLDAAASAFLTPHLNE